MAARRHVEGLDELSGQDSFLDIVANIVGILILLVVIIGIRAATLEPLQSTLPTTDQADDTADQLARVVKQLEQSSRDVVHFNRKAMLLAAEANDLDREREKLATYVAAVEQELASRREALESDRREQFDLRIAITSAEEELDALGQQQLALVSEPLDSERLMNVPTPISRRFDGEEVALRLEGGRVTVVPVKRLVAELESRGRDEFRRLRSHPDAMGRVGPIDGYQMLYTVVARQSVAPGGLAVTMHFLVAEIRPLESLQGELVDDAIRTDSRLSAELATLDPRTTAVTIWTYPDSFEDVQRLRLALYERGFPTALRPLPAGTHIGLSPFGSKSRVQ